MAYYEDRQYRRPRDRHGRPPGGHAKEYYYDEDPYGGRAHEVMRRRNGSDDTIEEVHPEYPKGDYGYEYGYGLPPPRHSRVSSVQEGVRRSHSMRDRDPYYEDSDYSRSRHSRRPKNYDDRRHRHRHSPRSPSSSRSPSPPRRRKSFSEQALGALGLGAAASSTSRHRDHSRGRSHRYRSSSYSPSPTRSRSRPRRDKSEQRIAQAVKAAVTAGAVEAFRSRKDPGEWTGAKGKRILTAAITAGGTDGLVDRDPNKHSKRHVIESTLAGLAANHFMNGSHSRSRSRHRGRSKSRGGFGDLAASGALAAAGKEAYDRFRSKSRHRGRSSSRDSYDESPRREKKRSKSVTDYINRGLGALGLDDKKDSDDRRDHHRRSRPSRYSEYSDDDDYDSGYRSRRYVSPRRSRHSRDPRDVDVGRPSYPSDIRRPRAASTTAMTAPQGNGGHNLENRHSEDCKTEGQDSDPGNSTDEEKQKKKLTRQTLMATGLATVASIHAAHSVHSSMEQHHKRMEMVKDGEMSPEEARRRRIKGNVVDAASIGLAAMGINGALEEWKNVNEKRKERTTFSKSCNEKRNQRHRRVQSHAPSSRETYRLPDEIEEYPAEPARSRSVVHEQPRYA
ncbi:hypothetical protein P170DRAFT_430878 [Aspergillus steynii IBT 23096]|uniref:DUF3824 domain-containing protein n=1 Tax=Aspergillus steynii IBT 23096 TaxID=1392250 RepID=A0A2I2FTB1_9EURO|nr:uncharacterized protein P170DRAFT_430878 [Aspergillus steynii IBT 23096]PLB43869.1 hypothetical protein P170DRAFT_430878 [Aspergillus steynii IBT 23096]